MLSLQVLLVLLSAILMTATVAEPSSKHSIDATVCRFLGEKFVASYPGASYPIIFEPINKGRLTIWTGISTLPTSEFRCYGAQNSNTNIALDFAHFVNKLDWTFYDMNKGVTHHGVSVNHCEEYTYKFDLKRKQLESYMDCDTVDAIEQSRSNATMSAIYTTCHDCNKPMLELVNAKIKEIIRRKLDEQLIDNLYWHLSGLLSNQHFNGPISFQEQF